MYKILLAILLFQVPAKANVKICSASAELVKVGRFFHQKDKNLYKKNEIQISKAKETINEPAHLIARWFQVLEHKQNFFNENKVLQSKFYDFFYRKFVTKESEIPESYYLNQQRLARERGHGDIELGTEQKQELAKILIEDQISSLKQWLDYLSSPDTKHYPVWAKYWVINSVVKLGKLDIENARFYGRSKGQISPFPELNREAFTYVIESFIKQVTKQKNENSSPEFLKLSQTTNFGKMYAFQLKQAHLKALEMSQLQKNVEGHWIKYNRGSDHIPLVESLRGKNTGWCTAGERTAKSQLSEGDFYVFYSLDQNKLASIPRLAIRMEGSKIAEIRGVGRDQNLDPIIAGTEVLHSKLKEFGEEGQSFIKKDSDMKRLTKIETATQENEELSSSDLVFLYELENSIEGFGYLKDPRIEEIILQRNIRSDLAKALQISENKISLEAKYNPLKKSEIDKVLQGESLVHYGKLDLQNYSNLETDILPERVIGFYAQSRNTYIDNGLHIPKSASGLLLSKAGNISNFTFGNELRSVSLTGVTNAKNISFSESINEISINDFPGLIDIQWPESLEYLTITDKVYDLPPPTPQGLIRLNVFGDFDTNGIALPNTITALQITNVTRLENITLSENLTEFHADGATSATGIKLPKSIEHIGLRHLQSAEGIDFTALDGAHITLSNLQTTKGFILPEAKVSLSIKEDLYHKNKDFFDRPNVGLYLIKPVTK